MAQKNLHTVLEKVALACLAVNSPNTMESQEIIDFLHELEMSVQRLDVREMDKALNSLVKHGYAACANDCYRVTISGIEKHTEHTLQKCPPRLVSTILENYHSVRPAA